MRGLVEVCDSNNDFTYVLPSWSIDNLYFIRSIDYLRRYGWRHNSSLVCGVSDQL